MAKYIGYMFVGTYIINKLLKVKYSIVAFEAAHRDSGEDITNKLKDQPNNPIQETTINIVSNLFVPLKNNSQTGFEIDLPDIKNMKESVIGVNNYVKTIFLRNPTLGKYQTNHSQLLLHYNGTSEKIFMSRNNENYQYFSYDVEKELVGINIEMDQDKVIIDADGEKNVFKREHNKFYALVHDPLNIINYNKTRVLPAFRKSQTIPTIKTCKLSIESDKYIFFVNDYRNQVYNIYDKDNECYIEDLNTSLYDDVKYYQKLNKLDNIHDALDYFKHCNKLNLLHEQFGIEHAFSCAPNYKDKPTQINPIIDKIKSPIQKYKIQDVLHKMYIHFDEKENKIRHYQKKLEKDKHGYVVCQCSIDFDEQSYPKLKPSDYYLNKLLHIKQKICSDDVKGPFTSAIPIMYIAKKNDRYDQREPIYTLSSMIHFNILLLMIDTLRNPDDIFKIVDELSKQEANNSSNEKANNLVKILTDFCSEVSTYKNQDSENINTTLYSHRYHGLRNDLKRKYKKIDKSKIDHNELIEDCICVIKKIKYLTEKLYKSIADYFDNTNNSEHVEEINNCFMYLREYNIDKKISLYEGAKEKILLDIITSILNHNFQEIQQCEGEIPDIEPGDLLGVTYRNHFMNLLKDRKLYKQAKKTISDANESMHFQKSITLEPSDLKNHYEYFYKNIINIINKVHKDNAQDFLSMIKKYSEFKQSLIDKKKQMSNIYGFLIYEKKKKNNLYEEHQLRLRSRSMEVDKLLKKECLHKENNDTVVKDKFRSRSMKITTPIESEKFSEARSSSDSLYVHNNRQKDAYIWNRW